MDNLVGNVVLGFAVSGATATATYALVCSLAGGTGLGFMSALRLGIGRIAGRWPVILTVGASVALGFLLAVALLPARSVDPAIAQACQRAVTTLLTTRDPVDLERSRILVSELGCSIRNALAQGGQATDPGQPAL